MRGTLNAEKVHEKSVRRDSTLQERRHDDFANQVFVGNNLNFIFFTIHLEDPSGFTETLS